MAQKEIQRMESFKYMFAGPAQAHGQAGHFKETQLRELASFSLWFYIPCSTSVVLQLGEVSLCVSSLSWLSDEPVFPEHLLCGRITGRPDGTTTGIQISFVSD